MSRVSVCLLTSGGTVTWAASSTHPTWYPPALYFPRRAAADRILSVVSSRPPGGRGKIRRIWGLVDSTAVILANSMPFLREGTCFKVSDCRDLVMSTHASAPSSICSIKLRVLSMKVNSSPSSWSMMVVGSARPRSFSTLDCIAATSTGLWLA